jgi:hypothetical protein
LVEDAVRFAEAAPVADLVISLASSLPAAQQVMDTAGALYTALRARGHLILLRRPCLPLTEASGEHRS